MLRNNSVMLIVLLCYSPLSLSNEIDYNSGNTYQGQEITAENILQLIPEPPHELEAKVQTYLKQKPILANIISGADYYNKIMFFDKAPFTLDFQPDTPDRPIVDLYFKTMESYIRQAGLPTKPGQNFVIPLGDHIIKASGFFNRRENINAYLRQTDPTQTHGKTILPAQLEKFNKEVGKTYQTISRVAYWLRLKELKETLNLDRICLPDKYLVHIPGRPLQVDDTNYVVAETALDDAVPFDQTDLAQDPEVIQQLTQAIGYAHLWDINSRNILVSGDKACIVDTEQPNVGVPTKFFLKDLKGKKGEHRGGWDELETNIIRPYAKSHPDIDLSKVRAVKHLIEESIKQA